MSTRDDHPPRIDVEAGALADALTLQRRVAALLAPCCGHEDPRRIATAAWLVTGLLLEQDARLPRLALAMAAPATQDARVRRLRRWLDGPFDVHGCYRVQVARMVRAWRVDDVMLVLDSTTVSGRMYYVRIAIVHAHRTLPLAWRVVPGRSATVDFGAYRTLLETAEAVLPRGMKRTLVADRGFQHLRLFRWCDRHGWLYRVRAKRSLSIELPDGTRRAVGELRSRVGALRVLDTVYLGAQRYGPAGLVMAWPRHGHPGGVHVVSSDAPSVRTLWEFERLYCVDRGFRDDKSSCFGLERVRIRAPFKTCRRERGRVLLGAWQDNW